MSLSGHVLPRSRDGKKMGPWEMVVSMVVDGLWCAFNDYHMGVTAENIASKFDYTREDQDQFAVSSQQKTESAQIADLFCDETTLRIDLDPLWCSQT
jgi:acetyl-CoA C-acetyltransferase